MERSSNTALERHSENLQKMQGTMVIFAVNLKRIIELIREK